MPVIAVLVNDISQPPKCHLNIKPNIYRFFDLPHRHTIQVEIVPFPLSSGRKVVPLPVVHTNRGYHIHTA